ncbi:MAG: hypothetical protein ACRDPM_04860, partial [Solirubrobacteraceae bacterium]
SWGPEEYCSAIERPRLTRAGVSATVSLPVAAWVRWRTTGRGLRPPRVAMHARGRSSSSTFLRRRLEPPVRSL